MREFIGVILIVISIRIVAYVETPMPNGATLLALMIFGLGIMLLTSEPRR